jgi:hypothetical protein
VTQGVTKAQSIAKTAIIRAILEAAPGSPELAKALDRRGSFNDRNPDRGVRIDDSEINSVARRNEKIEAGDTARQSRQAVEKATRWSGD